MATIVLVIRKRLEEIETKKGKRFVIEIFLFVIWNLNLGFFHLAVLGELAV